MFDAMTQGRTRAEALDMIVDWFGAMVGRRRFAVRVVNVRGAPVTGQAVPSYGPQHAGEYFRKVECFCFQQQTLAPGETRRMPVVFVVDPKLPRDVNTIALSYTFFEVPGRGGKS